ncbi:MAG: glycosyltransferase family 4 protein, partial [Phormidesmis sp.]
VLFLGLVTLRKGIGVLLEAIKQLAGEPIELQIVGSLHIEVPEALKNHPQIRWIGPVPRSQVAQQYQQADVFIFPTLSDGFGLTQLEAQSWKLPIIASPHCGQVVKHQQNGLLLPEITADAIAKAITYCYQHPGALATYASQAVSSNNFQLKDLSQRLIHIV